jgi:hypothetical protein
MLMKGKNKVPTGRKERIYILKNIVVIISSKCKSRTVPDKNMANVKENMNDIDDIDDISDQPDTCKFPVRSTIEPSRDKLMRVADLRMQLASSMQHSLIIDIKK